MKHLGASSREISNLLDNRFKELTLDQAVSYSRCLGQRVELVLFNDVTARTSNLKWRDPDDTCRRAGDTRNAQGRSGPRDARGK